MRESLTGRTFNGGAVQDIGASSTGLFLVGLRRRSKGDCDSVRAVQKMLQPTFRVTISSSVLMGAPFKFRLTKMLMGSTIAERTVAGSRVGGFLGFIRSSIICYGCCRMICVLFRAKVQVSRFYNLALGSVSLRGEAIGVSRRLREATSVQCVVRAAGASTKAEMLPVARSITRVFRTVVRSEGTPGIRGAVSKCDKFLFCSSGKVSLITVR